MTPHSWEYYLNRQYALEAKREYSVATKVKKEKIVIKRRPVPLPDDGSCPGVGQVPGKRKSFGKYVGNRYQTYEKFECPGCSQFFAKDRLGRVNYHGYPKKAKAKLPKLVAVCAECGSGIDYIDYLCFECRGEDGA